MVKPNTHSYIPVGFFQKLYLPYISLHHMLETTLCFQQIVPLEKNSKSKTFI